MSWKLPIERRVLDANDMRGVVIVSSVTCGDGGGRIPALVLSSPRDNARNLIMLGTGKQHWSTVHVVDLADLFRRVRENDSARGYYVAGDGLNPIVAELSEAAAIAVGAPGAGPGSDEEAWIRLGRYLAEVFLLDRPLTFLRSSAIRASPLRARGSGRSTGTTSESTACSQFAMSHAMLHLFMILD